MVNADLVQLVAFGATVLGGVAWALKRVVTSAKREILAEQGRESVSGELASLRTEFGSLNDSLIFHMEEEARVNAETARELQEINRRLKEISRMNADSRLAMLKALTSTSSVPHNIAKVWKGGYEYIWGNKAFLDLTGLNLTEVQSQTGIWSTIDPRDVERIRAAGETGGQDRVDFEVEYRIVNARTAKSQGWWRTMCHHIEGNEDYYYYFATLVPIDADGHAKEFASSV